MGILFQKESATPETITIYVTTTDIYQRFINAIVFKDEYDFSSGNILDIHNIDIQNTEVFLNNQRKFTVSPQMTVEDLANLIWPDNSDFTVLDTSFQKVNNFAHTTRTISCLQTGSYALETKTTLASYNIDHNYLFFIDEEYVNLNEWILACMQPVRNAETFLQSVTTEFPENNSYSHATQGIILYTDEDEQLCQYIRLNYHNLHKMSGSYKFKFIEQPHRLNGISTHEYWKSRLDAKRYTILNFLGYTGFKPYNKADVYEITEKAKIDLGDLPCVVLYRDMPKHEKIVIKISEDFVAFFRNLIATIQKVDEEIYQLQAENRKEIEESIPVVRVVSLVSKVGTPERKIEWDEEIKRQKAAGAVDKNEVWGIASDIYKSKNFEFETFGYFQKRFKEIWQNLSAAKKPEQAQYQFEFKGNTLFINNPQGQLTFSDFQNIKQ
jgi:hypothetical protein